MRKFYLKFAQLKIKTSILKPIFFLSNKKSLTTMASHKTVTAPFSNCCSVSEKAGILFVSSSGGVDKDVGRLEIFYQNIKFQLEN